MGTKRYELTESEWSRIKDMLPPELPKEGKRGRPAKCDNRTALNGMLWIARGGAPWRELPERYGAWQTVYSRFRKWKEMGIFEAIFQALSIDADRAFGFAPLALIPVPIAITHIASYFLPQAQIDFISDIFNSGITLVLSLACFGLDYLFLRREGNVKK